MLPVVALIGRPNVGKSTLFNRLTRTRDALVANQPGLTRDRKYGTADLNGMSVLLVDTGGLSGAEEGIDDLMAQQSRVAIDEADLVLFMVDARDGLTSVDQDVAQSLRQQGKSCILVVNKIDGQNEDIVCADFFSLGLGQPYPIAAEHGLGIGQLIEKTCTLLPEESPEDIAGEAEQGIRVVIVGRPNVGKSTLVNRILGEERVIVYDLPGTTRDCVYLPFERDGKRYTLIDTAGIRRKARVKEVVEKFSVIKTLQAIEKAHVVVFLIDAHEGLGDQDSSLLGFVIDSGRALVIAINKWDGMESDDRDWVRSELHRRLGFVDFARHHFISALHGSGVGDLFKSIQEAYACASRRFTTPRLNRILENAVRSHPPPSVQGRRIKLRYAHLGGSNPPRIIIHGNQTKSLPDPYRRYLSNTFRKTLHLVGTPVRLEFKTGENPFKGRKNKLTDRQIKKRRRLMSKVKSGR